VDHSALLADSKFIVPKIAMASTDVHSCEIIRVDIGVHQLDVAIVTTSEASDLAQLRTTDHVSNDIDCRQFEPRLEFRSCATQQGRGARGGRPTCRYSAPRSPISRKPCRGRRNGMLAPMPPGIR
jgi:hypothetical protein